MGNNTDKKIVVSDDFPFFKAYNDSSYIKFHDQRSVVSLKDDGKKGSTTTYVMTNSQNKDLVAYMIDGHLIPGSETNKCDFGVYLVNNELYLIELKGGDEKQYRHACEQISATIDQLINIPDIKVNAIHARIVVSQGHKPNVRYTEEAALLQKLKKYKTATEKLWAVKEYKDVVC